MTSTNEPECMAARITCTSDPPLTKEETQVAKEELINKSFINLSYPKTQRIRKDPPLGQQNYFLFTFVPSKNAQPDKDGCFGVMKVRGTFPTPREAEEWAENLIRNVDSFHENTIGYVGSEFPLTVDSKYCLTTREIDIRNKTDEIARDNIKQQRTHEKKEMDEIQERQKQLLADTSEHKESSIDDLDYYTTLRVKRANIRILQEECEKKIKECGKIIKKTITEINNLDDKHPEYKREYESKYKMALDAIGASEHSGAAAESTKKMIEYMK